MDLQIFQWGVFLLVFFYAFALSRIHGVQGRGGYYYFFKEGDFKTILRGGGVLLSDPPPSLISPSPPASRNNFPTCAGRAFLSFKKSPFEKHPCYKLLLSSTQVFPQDNFVPTEHQPNRKAQVAPYLARGAGSPGRDRRHESVQ
jgi:hypothetical protein